MTFSRIAMGLGISVLTAGAIVSQDSGSETPVAAAVPDLAQLEAEFARKMSGALLVGKFALDDAPDGALQSEAYRLGVVEKLEDDGRWRFEAEIEYGDKKYSLPLVLSVEWAGDTPVITLTDLAIPLIGTFTARVVIYGDRYAGIWEGGDHGGQMFGRLVTAEASAGEEEGDDSDE